MLKGIWNESQHIKAHIRSLPHVFATSCLGPDSCGTGMYAKKHLITSSEFTYMCFYMPLLQSCLGGTPFGARSSGPDSCGIGMPKSIWLHHRSHTCASTCLCYKVAWGHSVRGPTLVAQVCMPKNIWLHHQSSHTCASTCLCYKVAWGQSVRGPKFGARLLWHRYAKKHLITSSEFTYMCFYVHAFATKLPGGTPFGARSSGPDSCGIGME